MRRSPVSRAKQRPPGGGLSFAQIECARARKEGRRCRLRSRRRQSHTFRGGERNDDWRIEDPPKKSKRARSPKAIIAMIVAPLSLSLSLFLSVERCVRTSSSSLSRRARVKIDTQTSKDADEKAFVFFFFFPRKF